MNNERSLVIVRRHRPDRVPPEALRFTAMSVIAVVLSTYRSDSPDMFIDYDLWFACMREVGAVVGATKGEVYNEPRPTLLSWLWRRERPSGVSLNEFIARSRADSDAGEWTTILWWRDAKVVAAATREPFYLAGGPAPYHDSDTTSIFLDRGAAGRLISMLEDAVPRAGGVIERVLDSGGAA